MSTFPASEPVDARVRIHGGTVDVDTSHDGQVSATVEAVDPSDSRSVEAAAAARIDCDRGRLVVDVPGKGRWRGGVQVAVRLVLPARSSLRTEAGEVVLRVDGELEHLVVRTGSGEVVAPVVHGNVDVKAGDATVTLGSPKRVSFTTGNGTLTTDSAGDVMFKTGNGKAVLGSTSGAVMVKGGHVSLDLGAATGGPVMFQTGAGSAHVGVREGTTVQLDLQSGLGDVRCDIPVEAGAPSEGADLKVRLSTGMGDVVVARA